MRCPRCSNSPITFALFLIIGWVTITCHECSARLSLKTPGNRFWTTLTVGGLVIASIWFYLDFPYRLLGQTATLVVFVVVASTTFILAMYFAWKDGSCVLAQGS
jgi:hypothetical protein